MKVVIVLAGVGAVVAYGLAIVFGLRGEWPAAVMAIGVGWMLSTVVLVRK